MNKEYLHEKQIWYAPNKPFKQMDVTKIVMSSYFRN